MNPDYRMQLAQMISNIAIDDGLTKTGIPGVRCLKFTKPTPQRQGMWARSLVIVAQGQKEISLEKCVYRYDQAHYIATPIDLPVTSRIRKADHEMPYLALLLDFDEIQMSEVSKLMTPQKSDKIEILSHGIFTGKAADPMLEASVRLLGLITNMQDALILAPMVIREIYYHLLKGPNGSAIQEFNSSGTSIRKTTLAIQSVRANLNQEIDVEAMAKRAHMSRTSFFRTFKQLTSMSPIQYQKKLRLIEAQRLLQNGKASAESVAYEVGYNSASQFSREYTRMFDRSPSREADGQKK